MLKKQRVLICIACVILISGIITVKYVQNRIEVSKSIKQQELEDYRVNNGAKFDLPSGFTEDASLLSDKALMIGNIYSVKDMTPKGKAYKNGMYSLYVANLSESIVRSKYASQADYLNKIMEISDTVLFLSLPPNDNSFERPPNDKLVEDNASASVEIVPDTSSFVFVGAKKDIDNRIIEVRVKLDMKSAGIDFQKFASSWGLRGARSGKNVNTIKEIYEARNIYDNILSKIHQSGY